MGGLSTVLGGVAAGYGQAAAEDRQRQFEVEQHQRAQIDNMLGKLTDDENAHPYSRQAAAQARLELAQTPYGKFNAKKFGIDRFIAPYQPADVSSTGPRQVPGIQLQMPTPPPQGEGEPLAGAVPGGLPPPTLSLPTTMQAGATHTNAPEQPAGIWQTPEQQRERKAADVTSATSAQSRAQLQTQLQVRDEMAQQIREAVKAEGVPELEQAKEVAIRMAQVMGQPIPAWTYRAGKSTPMTAGMARQDPEWAPLVADTLKDTDTVQAQRGGMGEPLKVTQYLDPRLLPTITERPVEQSSGEIKAVPFKSGKQIPSSTGPKLQQPAPLPGSAAKPAAQATPSKSAAPTTPGRTVGGKSKTQLMVIPVKQPDGSVLPQVIMAKAGDKLPAGAVTPQQYGTTQVPTASTRTRAEFATGLIDETDRVLGMLSSPDMAKKLGAIKGRWNEMLAGKLGGGLDDDQDFVKLRTSVGMLQTGMMVPHVGARGGVKLIEKFKSMADSGKMSADQLKAAIGEWRHFLDTYSKEGAIKGWGNGSPLDAQDTQLAQPSAPPASASPSNSTPKGGGKAAKYGVPIP